MISVNTSVTALIEGLTLTGGSTSGDGGAIANSGTLGLTSTSIRGNSANDDGGGIHNLDGSVILTNSTVTENIADANNFGGGTGGGIWTFNDNATFTTLFNAIVSGNSLGSGTADNLAEKAPEAVSEGNLFGSSTNLASGQSLDATKNQTGIDDPKLGPLQDNGGPTFTHLPQSDSPAINQGVDARAVDDQNNSLTTDQRGVGFPRIIGGTVDIGAVEFSPLFQVTTLTSTTTGFIAQFNQDFDKAPINLFGRNPADVVLTAPNGSPVIGSLITTQNPREIQFIASQGLLAEETYSLTIRSGADAFQTSGGVALDGDADNTPGGNYTTSFTVAPFTGATVSLPDFTRGAGQTVELPLGTSGIPVTIDNAAVADRVAFDLRFDPSLLGITGARLGVDAPTGSAITFNALGSGQVSVAVIVTGGLPAGALELIRLDATVPNTAPLTDKHALDIQNLVVEQANSALSSRERDALHLAAYPGDVFLADQSYSILDVADLINAVLGIPFTTYPNADPTLVADVNGNGVLDVGDATPIVSATLGLPNPGLPMRPAVTPPIPAGLDPFLEIGRVEAQPGQTISVPLPLTNTDVVTVGVETIQAVIQFDPTLVTIAQVSPGDLGDEYGLLWHVDASAGLLFVVGARPIPLDLDPGDGGDLAWIDIEVSESLVEGDRVGLNLRADVPTDYGTLATGLNGGTLILIPAPTNAWDDPVDGQIDIVASQVAEDLIASASATLTPRASRATGSPAAFSSPLSKLLSYFGLTEAMSRFRTMLVLASTFQSLDSQDQEDDLLQFRDTIDQN